MTGPKGNSELCFPETLNVPRGKAEGNIGGSRGNKTHCFPWGQSLSVLLYLNKLSLHTWARSWSLSCLVHQSFVVSFVPYRTLFYVLIAKFVFFGFRTFIPYQLFSFFFSSDLKAFGSHGKEKFYSRHGWTQICHGLITCDSKVRELVSSVRPGELGCFDPWHVTRSCPIKKGVWVGRYNNPFWVDECGNS